MCSRLKELTTELPNPQVDRVLPGSTLEERCRQYFWYALKIKPLNEILNASEINVYKTAIAERDCRAATDLLYRRFPDAHPKASFILTEKKESKLWREIAVGNHFHELYLCRRLVEIDQAQRELDRFGMNVEPYRGSPFRTNDPLNIGKRSGQFDPRVAARDKPVRILLEIDFAGDSPVYSLALLKLSHAGVVLELHPLWELFLAFRLRDAGVRDPLVASILSRPIDSKIRAKIERHANDKFAGWFQVPVHPDRAYPREPAAN